jgi:hypothetical protein
VTEHLPALDQSLPSLLTFLSCFTGSALSCLYPWTQSTVADSNTFGEVKTSAEDTSTQTLFGLEHTPQHSSFSI